MLAAVAHELKNPIQTLGNLLYLASNDTSVIAAREHIALAQQELAVLLTIVTNTLGAVRDHSAETDITLAEILEISLRAHSEKIGYKRIAIDKRVQFPDVIRTSPIEVRMILDNILSNALEAVPMEGRVVIHVTRSRDWANPRRRGYRIVIADNGPGIGPEHEEKIFQPFFTTKTEKGTGIGLWIVERTIRKHGGSIHFRTSLQPHRTGTIFSVFLPVMVKPKPAVPPNVKSETASLGST
ncbi:MAG TPA: HAMP domain-containing sensor histidine kinase [Terriglobales bacterium]|nr:HAMP domain-containing sensor histidine kinase [Terriglobales bacterium]